MAAMPSPSTSVDYERGARPDKTARPAAANAPSADAGARAKPAPARQEDAGPRALDFAAVEEFLQLLARAIRQFHTYPATSPMCTDAIAACRKVLASLDTRDRLSFRVTPRELVVDHVASGAGTIVEHEIVRRLHRAHVAALDIDRGASARDLSRFCSAVLGCDDLAKTKTTLSELLAEHGVETIVAQVALRPEVLQVGAPPAARCDLVSRERRRRQTAAVSGPPSYLYPPDKGWVRLDPASTLDTVSLVDLAILIDDPGEIASMLLRLTDDEAASESRDSALQQKFSDVATLLGALDPHLARVMFSKLARAVLDLSTERRTDLLRRTILPGLLDGRAEGTVLRDFPNVDLAESLCLLMDLETAAPELLTTAMDRLELTPERRELVAPLMEARLRDGAAASKAKADGRESDIDRHARRLIQVTPAAGKSFSEFAAFDLSIDSQTTATLADVREAIGTTDLPIVQLRFLLNLVRLEPNPVMVDAFLRRGLIALAELDRAGRPAELAAWAGEYHRLAAGLRPSRPDVADAIVSALASFCTPARALALSELYATDANGRARVNQVVAAFGVAMAPAFVALLDDPSMRAGARALVPLMCEHGRLLAPSLAARLGHGSVGAARAIIKVLGFAGPGYESVLADQLEHGDEQTGREAVQALTHIGSSRAAAVVGVHLHKGSDAVRAAAEEALRHFPPAAAAVAMRDLLGSREFVFQHPQIAVRLIDRAEQVGITQLEPALRALMPFRYRFWNPAVMRVARRASTIVGRR
jgi:HEAT repeat protein